MHSPLSVRARYLAELDRIGLDDEMCPYDGLVSGNDDAKEEFMRHLRSLAAGATWRDVYPDIPTHWDLGDPDSWTYPYRPIASLDYQTLPTGPVCMAAFPVDAPDAALDGFLTDARDAGFRVYGAGFLMVENPDWPDRPFRVVLDHRTSDDQLSAFFGMDASASRRAVAGCVARGQ